MKATVKGVRIAGIVSSVPEMDETSADGSVNTALSPEAEKLSNVIGVKTRRIADDRFCASDFAVQAAEKLMEQLGWEPESIDLLVFLTQGPDYLLPSTACLIQNRLGLPTTTAALDICLGCSGYTYGLWTAAQLLAGSEGKRALFLCGDVTSKTFHSDNTAVRMLFGDAGTATALERDANADPMYVVLGSDGSGGRHISIENGGARNSWLHAMQDGYVSPEFYANTEFKMNGSEVFTFTLKGIPGLIKEVMAYAQTSFEDIDYVVFHQANKFILEHLGKKIKIPNDKFIISMENFGNTSSASIPLAICEALPDKFTKPTKLLLAGFGMGWSWAAIVVEVGPIPQPCIVELPKNSPTLPLYPVKTA